MEFLLLPSNLPFTSALALVALFGVIELLSMLAGLSLLNLFDDLFAFDADADTEIGATGITGVAGWLCLNRLPLLIWLVLLLTSFSISGFTVTYVTLIIIGTTSLWMSSALALILSILSCRYLGAGLAKLLPKNETSAVSIDDLAGTVAMITLGRAKKGMPSEAVVEDKFKQKHYVMVEPEESDNTFEKGTKVVLLQRNNSIWQAARLEY